MKKIDFQNVFEHAYNYSKYRRMITGLLAEGKTTGPNQGEDLIQYAMLNDKRMDRGEKTVKLSEEQADNLRGVQPENWLVLTEGWCGDASQILPVLNVIDQHSTQINVRYILRDENPEIMDVFLTNGTRSIPKIIRLNDDFTEVLGSWGPRPKQMQALVEDWKKSQDVPKEEMYMKVHGAYAKDRGKATLAEIFNFLKQTSPESV